VSGTTPVEVILNGIAVGRRHLKFWGRERDCWFIELPDRLCRQARVDTGDQIFITLERASTALPEELSTLITNDLGARRRWESMTTGQQRQLAERVREAKLPLTRRRRAERALNSP
jgi:hypothetical protein